MDIMKDDRPSITMRPTAEMVQVGPFGPLVRIWEGRTNKGSKVKVLVVSVGCDSQDAQANKELQEEMKLLSMPPGVKGFAVDVIL